MVSELVQPFGDLFHSRVPPDFLANRVAKDTDELCSEFHGEFQVSASDENLPSTLIGVRRVECDGGGETGNAEAGRLKQTSAPGQPLWAQAGHLQEVGLSLHQPDFNTVIAPFGPVANHLVKRPVWAGER